MSVRSAAQKFIQFVDQTGSPYHTVLACKQILKAKGFLEVSELSPWKIERGGKYFITRNGSDIVAFVVGKSFDPAKNGMSIIAAHSDSPCLRLRPNTAESSQGYLQVGIQTYGGGLWHTWFDRPLGMAGKVIIKTADGRLEEHLVSIRKPVLILPNLAIHIQTAEERKAFQVNPEKHLQPIICTQLKDDELNKRDEVFTQSVQDARKRLRSYDTLGAHHPVLLQLLADEVNCSPAAIQEVDMCLMDIQPSCLVGVYEEFVSCPRIDNLISTWCAFDALAEASTETGEIMIAASFDHEECGSVSAVGADSNQMPTYLTKILQGLNVPDALPEVIARSLLVSADSAHATHPNYAEKHQTQHQIKFHQGIAFKMNSNQRYATSATSAALTREICRMVECPVQDFVVRNDCGCGSTVGPMLSARLGIRAIDVGAPQWAMHSCRETCASDDVHYLRLLCGGVFKHLREVDNKLSAL